ncbi:MAG TPA: IPTL-CTERM sorting domain-containing protein [Thermoanaerobaculia bacterium]|nr:IPTL-CTERM sorting domain-containing protein [Thermoanaerobaculia bacterium]
MGLFPRRVRAFIGLLLVFSLAFGPTVSAAVLTVAHSGTPDYPTITQALAAANPGDEIQVAPGLYDMASGELFPLALKDAVRIAGADRDTTTIAAPPGVPVFFNEDTPLSATTFLGGFTLEHESGGDGDVLMEFIVGNSLMSPRIEGNRFHPGDDAAATGIAILGENASSGIFNGTIFGNEISGFGGAVAPEMLPFGRGMSAQQIPIFQGGGIAMALITLPSSTARRRGVATEGAPPVAEGQITPTISGNTFSDNAGAIGILGSTPYSYYYDAAGVMAPVIDDNAFDTDFADVAMLYTGEGTRMFAPQITNNQSSESFVHIFSVPFFGDGGPAGAKGISTHAAGSDFVLNRETLRTLQQKMKKRMQTPRPAMRKQTRRDVGPNAAGDVVYDLTISGNTVTDSAFGGVFLYQYLYGTADVAISVDVSDNNFAAAGDAPGGPGGIATGFFIDEGADTSTDSLHFIENQVTGFAAGLNVFVQTGCLCERTGLGAQGIAPVSLHDITVTGNRLENNDDGFVIDTDGYTTLAPLVSCNVFANNETAGAAIGPGSGPTPDFGGGSRLSPGNNTLVNNGSFDMENHNPALVKAENNFWGTTDLPTIEANTFDITEDATVGEIDFDPPLAQAAACAPLVIPGDVADLSLIKTVTTPGPYEVGDFIMYDLSVTNVGPQTATNVVITDTLPAGLQFMSASAGCTHNTGVVTCTIATLGATESQTRSITVQATAIGLQTNNATADSDETDPTPPAASVPILIGAPANVAGVPTASEWGLLLMGLMLAIAGVWFTRKT